METVIGVFSSRERAEEAVGALLKQHVPEDAIVFLSRSESEAKTVGKQLGASLGGFMGLATGASAGVAAATLLIPGIGPVFALGFGAAALLGLAGAGTGAAVGGKIADSDKALKPTPDAKAAEDVAFFHEVLKAGRSLIVVRTDSAETATNACSILDRLGMGLRGQVPVKTQVSGREVDDVSVIEVSGRITIGDGSVAVRERISQALEKGIKKILLDLHGVGYVDSSGLGELVRTYTSVRGQGGQMKLVNPSQRVKDLLQMTRLSAVFDIQSDEASALQSFGARR
ncbi:MAG TPA: STAS domain-containing protein [Candidatus Angelobacter sp.]|jgi:anti-sigma B factor antagonist